MKYYYQLVCFLLLIFVAPAIGAQDVMITNLAPGFGPVTADHFTMVSVVNTRPTDVRGILISTLTDLRGETVAETRSFPLTLAAGASLNSMDIIWTRRITYGQSSYATGFARTGLLGFGSFNLCVTFLSETGEQQSRTCTERESVPALDFSLVFPMNETTVPDDRPVLSWEDVSQYGVEKANLSYSLQVVEVYSGQSVAAALTTNPTLLDRRGIRSNSLLYPVSAAALRPEKTYAWQVSAAADGRELLASQQWSFRLEQTELPPDPVAASYAMLGTSVPNRHYLFTDNIQFGFDNNEGVTDLRYRIIDLSQRGEAIEKTPAIPDLEPGLNTLDIPIKPLGLSDEHLYRLEVFTPRGQTYYLQFRIKS